MINRMYKNNFLINIFFFFSFIPYISLIPLNTDIQPLFSLIGWMIIILNVKKVKLSKYEIIFLLFAFLMLVNIYLPKPPEFIDILRKNSALLLVFPIIYLTKRYIYRFNKKILTYVIYVYLSSVIIQLLFPSIYYNFLSNFFTHKVIEFGLRGVSGLMAEPTDFGFTCFMLLIINYLFFNLNYINKKIYFMHSILLVIMILMTISASGLISLVLFYSILFFKKYTKVVLIVLVFLIFFFPLILTTEQELFSGNRALSILLNLFENPFVVIENTSLFYRVFYNHIAILYLYDSFGLGYYGLGTTQDLIPYLIDKYHFYDIYPNRYDFFNYLESYGYGYGTKNIFAKMIINFGLLGLMIIIYFYSKICIETKGTIRLIILLAITLCIMQSFPLVYPLLWIIITIGFNYKDIQLQEFKCQ